ncbi:MAG TPA: AbrB/MazE/SpoVT family DNA-binding domain-containing protein [Candidatus Nanoarchaeia archaeon]|nr:AbrB/MazE/SpoVT family DNA-binding domain-containing protein [Candidatus Nanoarchaeia archaeon]
MNEEIEATTRKWGSSLGIVIPNDIVEKENLKPNEKIKIVIKKQNFFKDLWGIAPVKDKRSTQEIVDELRKGW